MRSGWCPVFDTPSALVAQLHACFLAQDRHHQQQHQRQQQNIMVHFRAWYSIEESFLLSFLSLTNIFFHPVLGMSPFDFLCLPPPLCASSTKSLTHELQTL